MAIVTDTTIPFSFQAQQNFDFTFKYLTNTLWHLFYYV